MHRFNRLFWKIFAVSWLASISVILVTIIVIGELTERSSVREILEIRAHRQAEKTIELYERDPEKARRLVYRQQKSRHDRYDDDHWEHRDWDDDHRSHRDRYKRKPALLLNIYTSDGALLFGRPARYSGDEIRFTYTSEAGQNYLVSLPISPVKSHIARLKALLLSMQAVLVIITATLASLLLSWMIVRPINRLRDHVQQLHSGDLSTRLEPRLLGRGDEIGALAREFDYMASYVENTLQGQQRLLQDVSHELRAPLARLQAVSGLLEQRLGSDDKLVQRMHTEFERLDRLIEEMLSLARIEHLDSQSESFVLSAILEQALEDFRFTAPNRETQLTLDANAGDRFAGNSELMSRALSNILGNILKHTPSDSGVEIHVKPLGKSTAITISDAGGGVTPDALAHLFEPFYRQDQRNNGYGLGLSIAKRAVTRLGGAISAENTAKGLAVTINLPLFAK
ncbi:sensor histidine kinase [Neptunomonas marina]|uniref:histidine kinase n=1 Tax=Neptunomonas marina TaxID=1815562 RepID=A0A437QAY7_9GAMM|nr:ATP-binding protein [Neptunomonas marina]RVU31696.1 HAMP domain-containing protein [Neptunomonas marina]